MKQQARRMLAFVCVAAMVLALFTPATAYAAETDEPELEEEYIEIEVISDDLPEDENGAIAAAIPQSSVSVTITEETFFSFTPNVTGYWTFVTGYKTGDAAPFLRVTNYYGHQLAWDWGSGPDGNAIVKLHLVEGAPYVVQAGFDWGTTGRYTLTVFVSEVFERPITPIPEPAYIPGEGGEVSGYDWISYSFVPDTSGFWAFNVIVDGWYLDFEITDSRGNLIALNWDDMDLEFNATVLLAAGQEYHIRGWMDWDFPYTLVVTPTDTFEPWIDWDMLAFWDITLDLDAVREIIPSDGGETFVEEEAHFSFTPESSGLWTFDISNGSHDTWVIITDSYGSTLTPAETGWWNDRVTLYLLEDMEYVIWVSNDWFFDDFFLYLVISPYEEMEWDDDWDEDWIDDWERGTRIPSVGGVASLDDESWFFFSPDVTGSWTFNILNGRTGWNELRISDASNSFWLNEWDTGTISMHMAAGAEYTIEAWASWDNVGAVLQVSPTYVIRPHRGIRVSRRVMGETEFTFIPDQTGYWVISTSHALGATDPYLWLLDAEGNVIAQDDDGGEGLNALIKIHLEAGTELTIRAGFFAGAGEYILNVGMAGGEQAARPNLMILTPPAL